MQTWQLRVQQAASLDVVINSSARSMRAGAVIDRLVRSRALGVAEYESESKSRLAGVYQSSATASLDNFGTFAFDSLGAR